MTPKGEEVAPPTQALPAVELVAGRPNSLLVPEDVRISLGIRMGNVDQIAVAEKPGRTRPLVMPGSTALDPARLIRVRVRFAPAELVEIGKIVDPHGSPGNVPPLRCDLQAGDPVKKGDLLAVLFSVDVGNKKNDLFDALSQLRLDEEVLKRAEARSAAVPEVFLLNARCNVEADINAVNRAENTLRTWAIPDEDIQAVRDEVKRVINDANKHARDKERLKQWARVELRVPEDGILIEQNVAIHETVVDNTTNLFQIAKVDPLIVLAAVPEDDLPALESLKNQSQNLVPWTVRTVGALPMAGFIDDIAYLIDPNQHTAVVRGHIPNPNGLLRRPVRHRHGGTAASQGRRRSTDRRSGGRRQGLDRLRANRPGKAHLHDAPRASDQPLRPHGLRSQCPCDPRRGRRPGRGRSTTVH